ncbi:hypothetical protein UFOVP147_18 [uncultured Caudovirales phage]|uniref:Uncharacterized protein n=1 Tax=uncultured Caudovirales phage TaxID=2100421 RepID=A0A6J7W5A0_9CAUD|nr:hypothetical protein UFOVP147_18 [uncultured Caudovirales phage]
MNVDYWPWARSYTRTVFAFRQHFRIVWPDDAAYCLDRVSL